MANRGKRISELTALTSASLDTTIVGIDNGTTYKIELDILADAVTSRVNILDRDRLASLESVTSSFETKGRNVVSGSSQLTSSFDGRYIISGSITQTTWDNIASKPADIISSSTQISDLGFISSSHTDITSLNSFTSSQSSLNTAFTNGIGARLQTSSFNDFSASVHSEIVAATNEQSLTHLVTTSSFNEYTASISTASLVDRLNSIENVSGSWITESEMSSFATTGSNLFVGEQTISGSIIPAVSGSYDLGSLSNPWRSVYVGTGSIYLVDDTAQTTKTLSATTIITTHDIASGSIDITPVLPNGVVSGSSQLTSSYDIRYTLSGSVQPLPNGLISGSSQLTSSYDTRYTLSGSVVSGTTPAGTVSGSSQLTSSFDGRYVQTGSFNTLTTSFNSFTASAQSVTTGSNSFNGTQTITGSLIITTGSFVASQILANTASLYLTSGSNLYVQNNGVVEITGSLKVSGSTMFAAAGGDEGGEIQFAIPATNTTLENRVATDVYQNRYRIFEGSANAKGVYIDLSKAPNGVGGELMWKASGFVNTGVDVTLGNLKARIPSSGNVSLQLSTISGTYTVYGSGVYSYNGIGGATIPSPVTITTTPTYIAPGYTFVVAGATDIWTIMDTSAGIVWRITMIIGTGFLNNFISIERLH